MIPLRPPGSVAPYVTFNAVAFDNQTNLIAVGSFVGNAMSNNLVSPNIYSGLVAKWNYNDTLLWDTALQGTNLAGTYAEGVAVDAANNIYVGGRTSWSATNQAATLSIQGQTPGVVANYSLLGQTDGYLAMLSSNGDPQWISGAGGSGGAGVAGYANFHRLAISGTNVYVGGVEQLSNAAAILFGGKIPVLTGNAGFVAAYATNGSFEWVRTLPQGTPTALDLTPQGLAVQTDGSLLLAGYQNYVSASQEDSYVADLSTTQTNQWPWVFLHVNQHVPTATWYGGGTLLGSTMLPAWQILATNWPATNHQYQYTDTSTNRYRFYKLSLP